MSHRYSGFSAADAYSPPLPSSTAPMLGNEQSPFHSGEGLPRRSSARTEDDDSSEDWNVYDDFNNARPAAASLAREAYSRQSDRSRSPSGSHAGYLDVPHAWALGHANQQQQQNRKTLIPSGAFGFDVRNGDPQLMTGVEPAMRGYSEGRMQDKDEERDMAGIELITVPALGSEYTSEEVKAMKKPYKRRRKAKTKGVKAQRWIKTDDLYCGCLSPRIAVFIAFVFCAVLAVLLYFVIPRVPTMAVQTITPLIAVPDGASMLTNHRPTNFSMNMRVNLRADNTGGWVPTKVNKMDIIVTDISTSKKFPVSFAYASLNATGDETWLHWINACGPRYANTPRQSLNLQFSIEMSIQGLIGKKGSSAQLSNIECPFTLQSFQT